MAYAKSFHASITIFPGFEADGYCQYLKEEITQWIIDCYNAYTDFFKLKVSQSKGTAVLYQFDVEAGDVELNTQKIWKVPRGIFTIDIQGSGIINYGVKNKLEPPYNIAEDCMDKIYLKYQESSAVYPPKIITYGKNPLTRNMNVPCEYTFDGFDNEDWEFGSKYYDVYAEKWKISVKTNTSNFLQVLDIFNELQQLNKNKLVKFYSDEFENIIEMSGQFILKNDDKEAYLKVLNKLSEFLIEDDFFEIPEYSMNFISESENSFYFETYYLDDFCGNFKVRNIEI